MGSQFDLDNYVDVLSDLELERMNPPEQIDWRDHGAVSPVEDQGKCGSCWAFAAAGQIEAQYYLKYKRRIKVSKQELIDCSSKWTNNSGCDGGFQPDTFVYILLRGLSGEADYPYTSNGTGKAGECRETKKKAVPTLRAIKYFEGEENLRKVVGIFGPIWVVLSDDCDVQGFTKYSGGLYEHESLNCLESVYHCLFEPQEAHSVLVVGYGSRDGENYWILKNTWGDDWGDDGYMLFPRGENLCDIADEAHLVLV